MLQDTPLKINGLSKHYPSFELKNVSLDLQSGKITGFIGRNGAGKSTTLKSMLGFVHPDAGSVEFFGLPFAEHELEIKQQIGFVAGEINYYQTKRLCTITNITRRFYSGWDDAAYRHYMELFKLDERKTPAQLSAGMRVKYALALALSHNARLLILDEPTSGLDPVSRDELLDIFMELADKDITIFFSTHITSDLDRCADNIIYIKNGEIIAQDNLKAFVEGYRVATLSERSQDERLIGCKRAKDGYTALVKTADSVDFESVKPADLEEIMVHIEKEDE